MQELIDSVELTEKSEVKQIKNFLQQIKDEKVDYTKINELIQNKFPDNKCEIISHNNNKQVLCIDSDDYISTYYEILFAMTLARKYYTKIDSNLSKFYFITNQGNRQNINIDIKIENVTALYNTKCKLALEYYFDAGYRFSDEGWDNDRKVNCEIVLHQNSKQVILHCYAIRKYVSTGQGNNWSKYGYIRRSKYSNYLWFDDANVSEIFEDGDSDLLWVILYGKTLLYASYLINKEDILKACKTTKLIKKDLEKLQSKLVKDDFIIELNDKIKNLEIKTEDFIVDGAIVKEITFYTNHAIASIDAGLKFIVIKQEKDDFVYRFNGSIGKESLSYVRPIETDTDIKNAIEMTMNMIQYSTSLNIYKDDLMEILNSL